MNWVKFGGIQKYGQLLYGWVKYGVLGQEISEGDTGTIGVTVSKDNRDILDIFTMIAGALK